MFAIPRVQRPIYRLLWNVTGKEIGMLPMNFGSNLRQSMSASTSLQTFSRWPDRGTSRLTAHLEFINTLCEEPRFLGTLADQIRNSTYRKELAITGQVVLRKLRERADSDYLTTALAAAKSDDLSLLRSAAAGMWGITCEPASADDLKILDHLMLREDQYVRETVVRTLWTI